MARSWQTIDRVETDAGLLELRRRGAGDYLITIEGRVLMNSHANRSEIALATLALSRLAASASPRVLIGGLGMGCTLRAALDALPATARVRVAELHPAVVRWCGGPLAPLNREVLADPRVEVCGVDVADLIRAARDSFDAILLDLYEGPHAGTDPVGDPFYGMAALEAARRALVSGGVLGIWGEDPDVAVEGRLRRLGFEIERHRPGRGARRHAVTLAVKSA
jgi:spermidine synthase